jgi:excinuclease UvrABC nuclease subunit
MHEALPLFPELLPSVPFEERRRLPHDSGVYFALTSDGDVLYIGATQDLYHRWVYRHNKTEQLDTLGCCTIAFYVCDMLFLADAEDAMISQFQPPLNSKMSYRYKGGTPYWTYTPNTRRP